jgi:hypothetical protein
MGGQQLNEILYYAFEISMVDYIFNLDNCNFFAVVGHFK